MDIQNATQCPLKLLNKMTLTHKEFIKNEKHINIRNTNIKVGNKYYYVNQNVLMNFIMNEKFSKYRIHIFENTETKTRFIKLVWVSE